MKLEHAQVILPVLVVRPVIAAAREHPTPRRRLHCFEELASLTQFSKFFSRKRRFNAFLTPMER
jgi:hypothetical protein